MRQQQPCSGGALSMHFQFPSKVGRSVSIQHSPSIQLKSNVLAPQGIFAYCNFRQESPISISSSVCGTRSISRFLFPFPFPDEKLFFERFETRLKNINKLLNGDTLAVFFLSNCAHAQLFCPGWKISKPQNMDVTLR